MVLSPDFILRVSPRVVSSSSMVDVVVTQIDLKQQKSVRKLVLNIYLQLLLLQVKVSRSTVSETHLDSSICLVLLSLIIDCH